MDNKPKEKHWLLKIPVFRKLLIWMQRTKIEALERVSVYELIKVYINGLAEGAFSYKSSGIAFSFFMAIFPFALFILNLIPYIPIDNFQEYFMEFIEENVPPTTFEAIKNTIDDILNNSYKGLLSYGVLLSIFLMSNGVNAIVGAFESSYHVKNKRSFIGQYLVSLAISLLLCMMLILTVALLISSEVIIQLIQFHKFKFFADISMIEIIRWVFVSFMVLTAISILFKLGTKELKEVPFFNIGSVTTTLLFIITSYFFGIYVSEFAQYNELYGSIGTLLILMFYVWINCMILLVGFDLIALIHKFKNKKQIAEMVPKVLPSSTEISG